MANSITPIMAAMFVALRCPKNLPAMNAAYMTGLLGVKNVKRAKAGRTPMCRGISPFIDGRLIGRPVHGLKEQMSA